MTPERSTPPAPKRPYEVFGITEQECQDWRLSQARFEEILGDEKTAIHEIKLSSNEYGEFLFVTTSRPGDRARIGMTFYGLGYHEQRERWITDEWFWYQTELYPDRLKQNMGKDEAQELLKQRTEKIAPDIGKDAQTERGKRFEMLADLTDDDAALAELDDLESLNAWLSELDQDMPPEEPPPNGEFLLDESSRKKLPPLYSGEEVGLDAMAQVKFFTPDSNWTWYASEFDGDDIFFGLVSGLEVELGYFSLKELQETSGPLGILIERDLHFEPKKLGELMETHRNRETIQEAISETDQVLISFDEIASNAKEHVLQSGEHLPTLILEADNKIVVGQIPDMPESHGERIELMRILGETAARSGKVNQLQQVFMISEGWMRMAANGKEPEMPPSMDPERKEVLIISLRNVRENSKQIKLFEMIRDQNDQVIDLNEIVPNEKINDESVEVPLLDAFVRGFKGVFRTKFN